MLLKTYKYVAMHLYLGLGKATATKSLL